MAWYQSDSEYDVSLENWRTKHKDTMDNMKKEITKMKRVSTDKEKSNTLFSKILNFFRRNA